MERNKACIEELQSYGFRLIDSTRKEDSRGFAKQIGWSAMSREIWTHGDGQRAFERGGTGRALCGVRRRHRIAAFPGDLAVGAWPHGFASFGDDGVRRAMDRT